MPKSVQVYENRAIFQAKHTGAFRTSFARIAATAVLVAGIIILTPIYAFSQSKGERKKAQMEQASADTSFNYSVDSATTSMVVGKYRVILAKRGVENIPAFNMVLSMPMPSAERAAQGVEIKGKNGEHLFTLTKDDVDAVRRNGTYSITGYSGYCLVTFGDQETLYVLMKRPPSPIGGL